MAAMLFPLSVLAAQPALAATTDSLLTGETLSAGQALWSADNRYEAIMQTDGNLVVYGPSGAGWNIAKQVGGGARLVMQSDGNLVVYAASGSAAWSSSTAASHGDRLTLQSDGNLVIYDGSSRPLWSSLGGPTGLHGDSLNAVQSLSAGQAIWSADSAYAAIMQTDGNLVVYGPNGAAWDSRTSFGGGGVLVLQSDGNLVVYKPASSPAWSTTTSFGNGGVLVMQTDGNLVLYQPGGAASWSSRGGLIQPPTAPIAGGNYPNDGALCSHTGNRNGPCTQYDWGYKQTNGSWALLSGRGFGYRNCTDYAAWRRGLKWSSFGFPVGVGNAADWKTYAGTAGLRVSGTPAVGAIAWWGTKVGSAFGHVSIVTSINMDGTVETGDYNGDNLGNLGTQHSQVADAYLI